MKLNKIKIFSKFAISLVAKIRFGNFKKPFKNTQIVKFYRLKSLKSEKSIKSFNCFFFLQLTEIDPNRGYLSMYSREQLELLRNSLWDIKKLKRMFLAATMSTLSKEQNISKKSFFCHKKI